MATPVQVLAIDDSLSEQEGKVEYLTQQILLKEIDLERFYNQYRLFASKDPKFRIHRYFLLQQAAAALTLGSYIASCSELGQNLTTPDRISRQVIIRANDTGLLAVIFQGGSSAIEFGSNVYTTIKHKIKKVDPKSTVNNIQDRVNSIDALMAQRNEYINKISDPAAVDILRAEGRILKYFRDWCLNEFADIYADAKSYQASNNVYYVLDAASASLYAASYGVSRRSIDKPHLFLPASFIGIIGDGIGIVSAPASSWSYNYLYNHYRKRLSKNMKEPFYDPEAATKTEMAVLKEKIERTSSLSPSTMANIRARMSMLDFWSCDYDDYIEKTTVEYRRFSKVALQSNISGPLISGAFLGQDIMGVVNANSFKNSPMKSTGMGFASTIPPLVATGASLILSSYWYADEGIHQYLLKKKNATAEQLVAKRISTLEDVERTIQKQQNK